MVTKLETRFLRGQEQLARFEKYMQFKLELNKHKGPWKLTDIQKLFAHLKVEVEELQIEIDNFVDKKANNRQEIGMECADVANFAMMIADVAKALDDAYIPEIMI